MLRFGLASPVQRVRVVGSDGKAYEDPELTAMCDATVFARDLMNEQSDVANPSMLADVASTVAQEHGMQLHVVRGVEELEAAGLRLHAAVGQGSAFEPQLVTMEHRGDPASEDTVLLVGKGITFDTGGLNLKPTGFMETMHFDMGGAAATLAAMDAIGRLGVKLNVGESVGRANCWWEDSFSLLRHQPANFRWVQCVPLALQKTPSVLVLTNHTASSSHTTVLPYRLAILTQRAVWFWQTVSRDTIVCR